MLASYDPEMTRPIAASAFKAKLDYPYLVYCPDFGGWRVGEWWEADGPGRWVLTWNTSVKLRVTHVVDASADRRQSANIIRATLLQQIKPDQWP